MEQPVIITTDLGYGDAGKGTMVDALVHRYAIDLVVRYSGGAQAAHNVLTPDGRHHTFAQFGSGTFRPGTTTYLGPRVLVQPQHLLQEAAALTQKGVSDPLSLMHIDAAAPVITPYHQLVNQLKELARGTDRHGSTGLGIGETRSDAENNPTDYLKVGDLADPVLTTAKLSRLREDKRALTLSLLQAHASNQAIIDRWHRFADETLLTDTLTAYRQLIEQVSIVDASFLKQHLAAGKRAVFEAAQGTLLDEDYGFFPYVTRGKVRDVHAHELLSDIGYRSDSYVLGITRTYAVRHGPGPFPTENAWLRSQIHEPHNEHGAWQGAVRMGHFDAVATRYAIAANQRVDGLAVTCLDQLPPGDFYYAMAYTDAHMRYEWMTGLTLPKNIGNLRELAERSEYLMREVTPVYTKVSTDKRSVVEIIAAASGKPVVAQSAGMTRNEKLFFPAAHQRAA